MDVEIVKYRQRKDNAGIKAKSGSRRFFAKTGARSALTADELQLINTVLKAKDEWMESAVNFDYVSDGLLVDYYIYRMKACESRYTHFLRLAKEKGLSCYL